MQTILLLMLATPPQAPPVGLLAQAPACRPCLPQAQGVRKQPRPDGRGYCSDGCTCGCNDGLPCRCGSAPTDRPAPTSAPPTYYLPAAPTYSAPVRFRGGRGGGSC